jgi:TRAP transporter TAXI family solute receptor
MSAPARPWRKRRLLWAALLVFVASFLLSAWLLGSPPPRQIVLATGDPGGGFAALGREYKARLERMGLKVRLVESHGTIDNLQRLQRREADVAFVQAGVAQELDEADGTCALAAVASHALWVFARDGVPVESLRDLRGRRVAVGPTVSGTDALARLLLREHGVSEGNATLLNLPMGETPRALADGSADVALLVCSCDAPVLRELTHDRHVRLVSPRGQAGMARRFPYLRPVVLPEGALDLERDLPRKDTPLLAPAVVLAARDDLHPRAVEQVLMAARAVHANGSLLDEPGRFPSLEGVDLPPHLAAERFLRSGESFLARWLPYRGVRLVWQAQLLLLPLLTLLPLWKALPLLYSLRVNRILKRHYSALREAEGRIERCGSPAELRTQLETLDRLRGDLEGLARKLPAHLQRDVYHWRLHVALVRAEGLDRLRRLEERAGGAPAFPPSPPSEGRGEPVHPPDSAVAARENGKAIDNAADRV